MQDVCGACSYVLVVTQCSLDHGMVQLHRINFTLPMLPSTCSPLRSKGHSETQVVLCSGNHKHTTCI